MAVAALVWATAARAQQPAAGWQNMAPEDGVFGAAIGQMHRAAHGMKPSRKPVVGALIGFGADVSHKAIGNAVWKNPKEKPNGRDDDRNGWVDDLNGWNFLGNDSVTLDRISREGDRSYLHLRGRYGNYTSVEGGKAYGYDESGMAELPMPENREEFDYYLRARAESELAAAEGEQRTMQAQARFIRDIDRRMREEFPDKTLTIEDMAAIVNRPEATLTEKRLGALTGVLAGVVKNKGWDRMMGYEGEWDAIMGYAEKQIFPSLDAPRRQLADATPREIAVTGDDMYDLDRRGYGNGRLMAENAEQGTMQAGLIAGADNATVEGVAPRAKIMFLRVDAGERDESHVKDVALAIRYAVDKGAKIIQLGRGNTLYPYRYSQWVDDALRYAEQRGVLVVIPVMDLSYDLGEQPFYPNRHVAGGDLANVITVAASDAAGNPLINANFGQAELDIFAPGVEIESAYPGDRYAVSSGSFLAAAMVTGVAAFIKDYFPEIGPEQMRRLLMESVTPRVGAEVEKQFHMNGKQVADLFLFEQLSVAGGILNGAKAFGEAAKTR
jgi:hypothetical protein